METLNLIESFSEFKEFKNIDRETLMRILEEVFRNAGDLTPPQEHVNSEKYPYQVRTTVEGKPCLLFYRSNESEAPKL